MSLEIRHGCSALRRGPGATLPELQHHCAHGQRLRLRHCRFLLIGVQVVGPQPWPKRLIRIPARHQLHCQRPRRCRQEGVHQPDATLLQRRRRNRLAGQRRHHWELAELAGARRRAVHRYGAETREAAGDQSAIQAKPTTDAGSGHGRSPAMSDAGGSPTTEAGWWWRRPVNRMSRANRGETEREERGKKQGGAHVSEMLFTTIHIQTPIHTRPLRHKHTSWILTQQPDAQFYHLECSIPNKKVCRIKHTLI